VVANAFDVQHLQTVHERALRTEPTLRQLDPHRFEFRYESRVTGRSLMDRTIRRISGDRIRITITCWGGPLLTVESDLGRIRSSLLLGVMPTATGVDVTPLFALPSSRFRALDRLRLALCRWLFTGFMSRDIAIMEGMVFRPGAALPEDEALLRFLGFLKGLPSSEAALIYPTPARGR
jgi:hypothetical protein